MVLEGKKRGDNKMIEHNRAILTFNKDGETFSVRVSEHSAKRVNQRGIDENNILSAIFALKIERLIEAREEDKDLAVIDEKNDFALILGMTKNRINIITAIDKADIWVKEGTDTHRI